MQLRIKKLRKDAIVPKYAHVGDAALDVYSCEDKTLAPGERYVFTLGFATEFPVGYVCHVWDRSGLAAKKGLHTLAGVIDATYRDEYGVVMLNTSDEPVEIKKGDRIAQLVFQRIAEAEIQEVSELNGLDRKGGFGSTGT